MAPSDVCPTEDAVQAFLEHLVDPLLPEKSCVRDNPTPSQQQSIAKQVVFSSLITIYKLTCDFIFLFGHWFKLAVSLFG